MTLPYLVRLATLGLAAFFLVQVTVGLVVTMFAPRIIRTSTQLPSNQAAGRLWMLRLAPAGVAIFVVVGFCIPSYLWLEPTSSEKVGWRCLVLAGLAVVGWAVSASRAMRAWLDSRRYLRDSFASGRERVLHEAHAPACLTDHAGSPVALAGIFHPRVIVSRAAAAALSSEQLDAALRHERAHAESRDNLKRLAMLLVPNLLPRRTSTAIEQAWARAAEWAADDRAADGDAHRAVALAEALVRISQLTQDVFVPRIVTPLAADHLEARVDRLLSPPATFKPPSRVARTWWLLAGASAVSLLQPSLRPVYLILEKLI
jgi:hypothetical protein